MLRIYWQMGKTLNRLQGCTGWSMASKVFSYITHHFSSFPPENRHLYFMQFSSRNELYKMPSPIFREKKKKEEKYNMYLDHITKEEVHKQIYPWRPHHGEETKTQMVWSHLTFLWHGKEISAKQEVGADSPGQTEEKTGRQCKGLWMYQF